MIGEIISIGKNDGYYDCKEDLIGEEVEFEPTKTKHRGGGYRAGWFYATRKINLGRSSKLKGEAIYFAYVKVKIVKE